ncbi:universal stress protein [Natronococcus sp. A-GB1]|uniref:universal stress protein n=1 Tax=Natronococcus sp. A-GB1 TaxID=3037648 RepID=UPI00241F74D9|nr:universal stress protein [Natronococcus sp. A-GB1]MDG5761873.1 universal stress protein [Natronococcus sp. A-GB1]
MVHFQHVLVPVAEEKDARTTCSALRPFLEGTERVTAVHIIEKGGGAPDKAPLEKRREDASNFLAIVDSTLSSSIAVDTRTVFATDMVPALFSEAADVGADAIVFRARGGSRINRILAGNITTNLVTNPTVPVVSLPDSDS